MSALVMFMRSAHHCIAQPHNPGYRSNTSTQCPSFFRAKPASPLAAFLNARVLSDPKRDDKKCNVLRVIMMLVSLFHDYPELFVSQYKEIVVLIGQRSASHRRQRIQNTLAVSSSREHVVQVDLHVDEEAANARANVGSSRHPGEDRPRGKRETSREGHE